MNRKHKNISLMVILTLSFVITSLFGGIPIDEKSSNIDDLSLSDPKESATKDPFLIEGDAALTTFISTNSLNGLGTPASPYIIENFTIDASNDDGISISNTNKSLVIQNCTVFFGTGDSAFNGIRLIGVNNTIVRNNVLTGNSFGIWITDCYLTNITENNIVGGVFSGYGIYSSQSNNILINKNNVSYTVYGISSSGTCYFNTISENIIRHNSHHGMYLNVFVYNATVTKNIIYNNGLYGICIRGFCQNNSIIENAIYNNNNTGIMVENSHKNSIYLNDIFGNNVSQAYVGDTSTGNKCDNGTRGNYWGNDYILKYPSATNDGTVWDQAYAIDGVTNDYDNYPVVSQITLGILDYDKPVVVEVNCTDKIDVFEGYKDAGISWTFVDIYPNIYTIQLNGSEVVSATPWASDVPIIYNIPDGKTAGTYVYSIFVSDDNGNTVQNSVTFTVYNNETLLAALPELVYQIRYLDNILEWWRVYEYWYEHTQDNVTLHANITVWDPLVGDWKLHPDFQNSSIIAAVLNLTDDVWYPHQNYTGGWARSRDYGHAVGEKKTEAASFLEMPNLFHFFTRNGSKLAEMYRPDANITAALGPGQSFIYNNDATSYNVILKYNQTSGIPAIDFQLANNGSVVYEDFQKIRVNSFGITTFYSRETPFEDFTMVYDPFWRSSLCNITSTYWGKSVGDEITTTEVVNGKTSNVTYVITRIDDCTVQTTKVNEHMVSAPDPLFNIPASKVYANKSIWDTSLNQWIPVSQFTGGPIGAADSSDEVLIGCSLNSFGMPFIWNSSTEDPLFTDESALQMMLIFPETTGNFSLPSGSAPLAASSITEIFPLDLQVLGKLLPDIQNVSGTPSNPVITYIANGSTMVFSVTNFVVNVNFNIGGHACYFTSSIDPETGLLNSSGYLPSKEGFVAFSTNVNGYFPGGIPAALTGGSNGDPTPPNWTDYLWILIVAIAGVLGVAVILLINRKKKSSAKASEIKEEPIFK
jgi:parallel beta-helix repeat protein